MVVLHNFSSQFFAGLWVTQKLNWVCQMQALRRFLPHYFLSKLMFQLLVCCQTSWDWVQNLLSEHLNSKDRMLWDTPSRIPTILQNLPFGQKILAQGYQNLPLILVQGAMIPIEIYHAHWKRVCIPYQFLFLHFTIVHPGIQGLGIFAQKGWTRLPLSEYVSNA